MSLKNLGIGFGVIFIFTLVIVSATTFTIAIRMQENELHNRSDYQLYVGFNSITIKQKDRVVGVITEKSDSTFYNLILKDNE